MTAPRFSPFGGSNSSDTVIPLAMLLDFLNEASPASHDELEESPTVKHIKLLCQLITDYVDTALSNIDDRMNKSDSLKERMMLTQTIGILLVIGRGLQGALATFKEHLTHKMCVVRDSAIHDASHVMEQLEEWAKISPALEGNRDVTNIQATYQELALSVDEYEQEKRSKARAGQSKPDFFSMLFASAPGNSVNNGVPPDSPSLTRSSSTNSLFGQLSSSGSSLSRSSSSNSLTGVSRLFASSERSRNDAVQPESPSVTPPASPSSMRRS